MLFTIKLSTYVKFCPVGQDCRIHLLQLCTGVGLPKRDPDYNTIQSDGEVPVMLEL